MCTGRVVRLTYQVRVVDGVRELGGHQLLQGGDPVFPGGNVARHHLGEVEDGFGLVHHLQRQLPVHRSHLHLGGDTEAPRSPTRPVLRKKLLYIDRDSGGLPIEGAGAPPRPDLTPTYLLDFYYFIFLIIFLILKNNLC